MAKIVLKGEKVSLGYFENKEEFIKLIENLDLETEQFLGGRGRSIYSREVVEDLYNKDVENIKQGNYYLFAIVLNAENKIIGNIGLKLKKEILKGSVFIYTY